MKFIINLKTYLEGSGRRAYNLLKKLEKAQVDVTACLQPGDVHLSSKTSVPVWSQHVDPIHPGSHTGWILPENMAENGAEGILINHSEHRTKHTRMIIERCKSAGLKTMVLVPTAKEVAKVKRYEPDIIGVEPPKLIGSKKHSVVSKPYLIEKAVKNAGNYPLYVGAGIKSKHDVRVCKKLGAEGVLIASAIVKSEDPLKKLKGLY